MARVKGNLDPDDICATCKAPRSPLFAMLNITKNVKWHRFKLDKKATKLAALKREVKRREAGPTADDFVRVMEAWAAHEQDGTPATKHWYEIYEMAHVCFVNNKTGKPACPHPEWDKLFWKKYDALKEYWGK